MYIFIYYAYENQTWFLRAVIFKRRCARNFRNSFFFNYNSEAALTLKTPN